MSVLGDAAGWLSAAVVRRVYLESCISLARRRDGGNRGLRVLPPVEECVCGTQGCRRLWSECENHEEDAG